MEHEYAAIIQTFFSIPEHMSEIQEAEKKISAQLAVSMRQHLLLYTYKVMGMVELDNVIESFISRYKGRVKALLLKEQCQPGDRNSNSSIGVTSMSNAVPILVDLTTFMQEVQLVLKYLLNTDKVGNRSSPSLPISTPQSIMSQIYSTMCPQVQELQYKRVIEVPNENLEYQCSYFYSVISSAKGNLYEVGLNLHSSNGISPLSGKTTDAVNTVGTLSAKLSAYYDLTSAVQVELQGDCAIQQCIEMTLYTPIHTDLECYLNAYFSKEQSTLSNKLKLLAQESQQYFGIPADHESPTNWKETTYALQLMSIHTQPNEKLHALLGAVQIIQDTFIMEQRKIQDGRTIIIGADDFLPIFIFALVQANVTNLLTLNTLLKAIYISIKNPSLSDVAQYYLQVSSVVTNRYLRYM